MELNPLLLEHQLCFPLYACAREVVKAYTPHLDSIGLTYTQYIAMMVLWEHQHIPMKTLSTLLHLDSGTLTPLLKKMEQNGLITRTRAASDERSVIVSLTAEGAALRDRALHIPAEMGRCIDISPEDAAALHRILHTLLRHFQTKEGASS